MPTEIETFLFCGQTRYRCPKKWLGGSSCGYDTYDLDLLRDHIREVHSVKKSATPPMPTLFDATGERVVRPKAKDDDEFHFAHE